MRTRKIKDPLYGYIYLSELEHRLIQHPLLLRLHHVRQNSSVYLTYPSAHGTRFSHSLGAMHLAGTIVARALRLAKPDAIRALTRTLKGVLNEKDQKWEALLAGLKERDDQPDPINRDGLYAMQNVVPITNEDQLARLLLFQAVRLAILFHDVGHPPFSHIVELALERNPRRHYASHERVGRELLADVITTDAQVMLGRASLMIAARIFDDKEKARGKLHGISTLFAGDLDADRIDYVRRDAYTTGFGVPNYDIGRLVDAARLTKRSGKPTLEFTTDCLSTVEAFFLARFHLYRWTIWHHNAIRTDLALTRAVHLLLTMPLRQLPLEGQVARRWIDAPLGSVSTEKYIDFDDAGLLFHLRQLHKALKGKQNGRLKELTLLLDVFLNRRIDRLRALWKTADEYGRFAERVVKNGKRSDRVIALNEKLKRLYMTNYPKAPHKLEEAVEEKLSSIDGRIYARYLWRFKPAPNKVALLTRDGRRIPLTDLSPAVMALNTAWSGLPHLWLYVADGREEVHGDKEAQLAAIADALRALISGRR